jgi:Na+/H+ antiporter NhaA
LANTGIVLGTRWTQHLTTANSLGIIAGLILGKRLGIGSIEFCCRYHRHLSTPPDLNWRHIFGAGLLGGIGFMMVNLYFESGLCWKYGNDSRVEDRDSALFTNGPEPSGFCGSNSSAEL